MILQLASPAEVNYDEGDVIRSLVVEYLIEDKTVLPVLPVNKEVDLGYTRPESSTILGKAKGAVRCRQ